MSLLLLAAVLLFLAGALIVIVTKDGAEAFICRAVGVILMLISTTLVYNWTLGTPSTTGRMSGIGNPIYHLDQQVLIEAGQEYVIIGSDGTGTVVCIQNEKPLPQGTEYFRITWNKLIPYPAPADSPSTQPTTLPAVESTAYIQRATDLPATRPTEYAHTSTSNTMFTR